MLRKGWKTSCPKPGTTEFIQEGKHWLHGYFEGRHLGWRPPLHLKGTDFQQQVWKVLLTIPYGQTVSYGDVAKEVARERHMEKMSARAVGGAVGSNPVCLIVPCHRVVGALSNVGVSSIHLPHTDVSDFCSRLFLF